MSSVVLVKVLGRVTALVLAQDIWIVIQSVTIVIVLLLLNA